MKGIILAGGSGTRLHPLTVSVSKQLLPVYDKPMIYYPLNTLKQMGISEILIITTLSQQDMFKKQLNDGSDFGLKLSYAVQPEPKGLAEAFLIGEKFIGNDEVTLILGDNVFINNPEINMPRYITESSFQPIYHGACIYGYKVTNPCQYGVLDLGPCKTKLLKVVEKPTLNSAPSDYACVGLYCFDNTVVKKAKNVKPSNRGELEIVGVINQYIDEGKCNYELLEPGDAWFDCGNPDDLLECAEFIRALRYRANVNVGL